MTKKEELEAEIEATVAELPQRLPPEKAQIFVDRGMMKGNLAVFGIEQVLNADTGKHERKAVVHCTACGESFVTDYKKEYSLCRYGGESFSIKHPLHNGYIPNHTDMTCPKCMETVETAHSAGGYGSKRTIVSHRVFSIENVRNHFCILAWVLSKYADKNGIVSYAFERNEGVLLIGKRFVRVTSRYCNMRGSYSYLSQWERRKHFDDMLPDMYVKNILPFDMQEIYKTEAAHSAIDKYVEANLFNVYPIHLSLYIKLWTKHKNIENLAMQGFGRVISSALRNNMVGYYGTKKSLDLEYARKNINFKENRPHLMLGIEKEELPAARFWSIDQLKIFKYLRDSKGVKLDADMLKEIYKHGFSYSNVHDFFENEYNGFKPTVIRTFNYILSERKNEHICPGVISLQYLRDYWNALYKVNGEMTKELLYPKGIVKAHDDMNGKVKEKADREIDENIRKYSAANENLCFSDEETGLQIFPAPTHQSLITEGKTLRHCVARYASEVAAGKTLILFIRKTSEPDTPFFTLEYKNGSVAQNHGLSNCSRTAEVKAFEEKWLKFIKTKGNKNGKRNSKQSEQHAVA